MNKKKTAFIRALDNLALSLCELIYLLKDLLLVVALFSYMLKSGVTWGASALIILLILWILASLSVVHKEYIHRKSVDGSLKRFTFLDKDGNPSIRKEDIPEIIDYLYRMEESKYGKSGK